VRETMTTDPPENDLPRFPDIPLAGVRKSTFFVIEPEDIQTDADLQQLLQMIFNLPEASFYYFEGNGHRNGLMFGARDAGQLLLNEVEFEFYKHPRYRRDYVRIPKRDTYQFEWEKEVVEKGPMFMRFKLTLSERARRLFEVEERIKIEKKLDLNPLELKPNFFGIGVDLPRAWRWLVSAWRRLKPPKP
jgi:hypothetical protein